MSKLNTPTWRDEITTISSAPDNRIAHHTIYTPDGTLTYKTAGDRKTTWITEYLIKHDEDIELIRKYMPVPALDPAPIAKRYAEVGDAGILRGFVGRPGGLLAACGLPLRHHRAHLCGDGPAGLGACAAGHFLRKKFQFIETMRGAKFDLIETGGGSASSTLISPKLHREFCLPYDRQMHDALHSLGFKITYHTCGGTRGIEELIIANGADASETLAPPSVGGNQEPWEFKQKVGDRIAMIGGIDQFNTLTAGSNEDIRAMVHKLFETVGYEGGYLCSCSDHFFETPVEKLVAFADAARECVYA